MTRMFGGHTRLAFWFRRPSPKQSFQIPFALKVREGGDAFANTFATANPSRGGRDACAPQSDLFVPPRRD